MATDFEQGQVEANGITQAFIEAGEGPLVLLLHGFPDNAWTWEHQLPVLADAGYRAVAPFLRGYAPSEIPSGPFDTQDVTEDINALIAALGEDSAFVVGHDWGAVATLNVASVHPDSVKRALAIAVGHPATAIEIFKNPELLHYAFHIWLFQLEGWAEIALQENDFALVDYLWDHWSTQPADSEHLARVKKTLNEPGAVEAALNYYRGLLRIPADKPDFFTRITEPISVPTLIVYGADDPAQALSRDEAPFYSGEYVRETVPQAGHFVHREQPEKLNRLLLDWLKKT